VYNHNFQLKDSIAFPSSWSDLPQLKIFIYILITRRAGSVIFYWHTAPAKYYFPPLFKSADGI